MLNFGFIENEKAFEGKQTSFFLVPIVLFLRLKKQTSKNVADTIFNIDLGTFSYLIWYFHR